MGNVHMEAAQINYRGGEKKMSVEEALKSTSGEAAAIAQLQTDVANLRDVKANQITIAPAFSAETAYDPGDLVYYNGLFYRCVNAHEGEWDADDFAATTISNELASLESGLTNRFVNLITANAISVANTAKAGTTIAKAQLRHDDRFAELVINITNADSFDTGDTGVMLNIDWSKTGVSFNEFKSACGTCNTNASYPDFAKAGAISSWTLVDTGDVYMRLSESGIKAARLCFVFKLAW